MTVSSRGPTNGFGDGLNDGFFIAPDSYEHSPLRRTHAHFTLGTEPRISSGLVGKKPKIHWCSGESAGTKLAQTPVLQSQADRKNQRAVEERDKINP